MLLSLSLSLSLTGSRITRENMSEQIVPKRFGLKYSPKPAIALEYEKANSGG